MNNALTVLGIVGIGIISGVVYQNYDIFCCINRIHYEDNGFITPWRKVKLCEEW